MPRTVPLILLVMLLVLTPLTGCNRTGSTPKTTPTTTPKTIPNTTPGTPTKPATTAPATTAPSTPMAGHENSNPATLEDLAQTALRLVNQARATGRTCKDDKLNEGYFAAAKPVGWNLKLETSARNHSSDMQQKNYFAHASPSGVTLQKRLEKVGYVWRLIGENIAAGQPTLERAMTGWIGSAGHCAVLMNPDFTQMGLARIDGATDNSFKVYWTLDFGTPR
jgi:uncharacterized protein YkwD